MSKEREDELSLILSNEDMMVIKNITEKSRESMFVRSKEKLMKKFDILKNHNKNTEKFRNIRPFKYTKVPVLNICILKLFQIIIKSY